jgi:FdrA protein
VSVPAGSTSAAPVSGAPAPAMCVLGALRRGAYADSIALMQIAEELRRLPGVESAALVMATPANLAQLAAAEVLPAEAAGATGDDLLIAVRAADAAGARTAVARADALLARPSGDSRAHAELPPRSLVSAARRAGARIAVIAVPGERAVTEAQQALSAGLHVFLFSDGVPPAAERALKLRARARDLLVMGPECGTSIVGGVGLGFANRVRAGAIGLVGASGTGLQEVTALIHRLGGGISHAIGTGGRDLHAEIGGVTTRQAIELLAADGATRVLVLVSKPAAEAVARDVLAAAAAGGKPAIACLLGWRGEAPAGVQVVESLEEAAVAAVRALGAEPPPIERPKIPARRGPRGRVLGLFTGGTLCDEAHRVSGGAARDFVDFGAEEYTRGRPHPMIDPALRAAAVARAGDEADVGVLLVDVVLGSCAHPDPARSLVAAIGDARARAARRGRGLEVVAHVVGTEDDPQGLAAQEDALRAAGAVVCATNRLAARIARELAGGEPAGGA